MNKNLFKKAAVFTDIHFGKKGDSEQHNQDCIDYIQWFCQEVKKNKCDCVLFLGDYFDNQSRLGLNTLFSGVYGIHLLQELGVPIYVIVGNHDMFFKANRSIHSVSWMEQYDNVHLVNEITELGDVTFFPFLVGAEYLQIPKSKSTYIFGHFELPTFLVNAGREMHDRGGAHGDHFENCQGVFSGHFHMRQIKENKHGVPIHYIGNTFPFDFNDVNDRKRGMMILEWGEQPVYIDWSDAPNFNRINVSTLLDIIGDGTLNQRFSIKSIVECKDDVNITLEEAVELREMVQPMVRNFIFREHDPEIDFSEVTDLGEDRENIDELVIRHLNEFDMKTDTIDRDLLIEIYKGNYNERKD